MTALFDRLADLLAARFGVPLAEIRPEARLTELDLDSLALVEFGLAAEKEFGVRISEDDVTTDDTVDDLVRLLTGKGGR
ncbi:MULTISPECIES: acyl carrier protein [unclassified Saccharothrix]|uniref:acyl carrier protein n=1 Tax=unclassified Saccharothrix TaxID=2593673 RepID=UPI00307F0C99